MSKKLDFTQVALRVVQQAAGDLPKLEAPKQKAKGKATGGAKRMADMTPEQRQELAQKAAAARWGLKQKAPVPQEATGVRKR
jgi:hypothetical protein